jgi:uncharacterized protein (TIGR03437 family)
MRFGFGFALAALGAILATAASAQPPTISGLENNYSFILAGLPNYGIAQGSIFDIFGTNLAASTTPLQSVPLQTTLNGVTVNVTVNGTTVHPIFYYVTPNQIAAILPSATPIGTGQIAVTNNGQTSAPAQIQVVQGAFGILTLNGAGYGPAAAFDAKSNYLGFTNAANPGDYITLWGTGVGPVSGDETRLQTPQNLTNVPIEVDIGGVPATVAYRGRSAYPGLDQINVVVPGGVQQGCYVSVVVRSGNVVSNFATIPLAASGRTCSDPVTGFTAEEMQTLTSKGSFSIGSISLGKSGGTDSASAVFGRYTSDQFNGTIFGQTISIGSCWVYGFASNTSSFPIQPTRLDAGPAVNITGPNGKQTIIPQDGVYGGTIGGGSSTPPLPVFIPATGGTFNFGNGTGGGDVRAFTAGLTLGSPLVWSNMPAGTIYDITVFNRSQGLTVKWTGGSPNSYVRIDGSSTLISPSRQLGGHFICTAAVDARQFTVPAAVLLAIPPNVSVSGGSVSISLTGTLAISNYTNPQRFTALGLDLAFTSGYMTNSALVGYQ